MSKTRQKFDFGMEPKVSILRYIPHASRSLLCIRFDAVAFQSEEEVRWRRGPPVTYFCPALDPPLGGSGRKTTTLVRDHEYFIPTKFHQNLSSGSGEEVENVKVYSRRRTTTDRRTDDGRCAMTIAHLSLWLRWAKKRYYLAFMALGLGPYNGPKFTRKKSLGQDTTGKFERSLFQVKEYCKNTQMKEIIRSFNLILFRKLIKLTPLDQYTVSLQ